MIMVNFEAQCSLELAILDYMSKRGFHQTAEAFSIEIRANQNSIAANSPHDAFLQTWWDKFYEAYNSKFPDVPIFTVESFDKIAQTVENIVTKSHAENQSYDSNITGANISTVMSESSDPDLTDARISALLSSFDAGYVLPDLSPERDMTSDLQSTEMSGMLPFASNSSYQMQQIPTVHPEWNARIDRPIQMEANIHAVANTLPALPELSDTGNNRSLQQASHQGCPSVGVGSIPLVISHQVVHPSVAMPAQNEQFLETTSFSQQDILPNVAVQTLDKLKLPILTSSDDFFPMLTQVDSSGKDAGMFSDRIQRTSENLTIDQQIIASTGGIMRSFEKQSIVQEQVNQLGLQSSNEVEKEKLDVVGSAALADTQVEWEDNSFKEISKLHTKNSKLLCCHFDSKGELLATAGNDKKVLIWELGNNNIYSGEGHAHYITDVRFRPNSTMFATSSFDRTVKIWDAIMPSNPFQDLVGHVEHVMSIDFHPTKMDLLSSCDSNDDIMLWDVTRGDCKLIFKGGSRQVRFQPRLGDLLASSTGNIINIFDVETNNIQKKLKGHIKDIRSICWDMSGNYLASVSEDSARIWSVSEEKCLHELCSGGNIFQSCIFHPGYAQVLVIGSFEFLELWNPMFQSNITRPYSAHAGIISSLTDSLSKGTIASVSHDQWIKIWR